MNSATSVLKAYFPACLHGRSHPSAAVMPTPKKCEVSRGGNSLRSRDGSLLVRHCRIGPHRHGRDFFAGIGCHPGKLGLGFREMCHTMRHAAVLGPPWNVSPLEVSGTNPGVLCPLVFRRPARDISRGHAGKVRRGSGFVQIVPRRRPWLGMDGTPGTVPSTSSAGSQRSRNGPT